MPDKPIPTMHGFPADLAPGHGMVHPLDDFYTRAGEPLPSVTRLEGGAMPEPHKSLLVHQNDMTPTLEAFHHRRIHLRVLGRRRAGGEYFREVVLVLDGSERPVEFGAIKIHLDRFPEAAREQILAEHRPLGRILAECGVTHSSRPAAFLSIESDRLMNEALNLDGQRRLFGRRNTIYDSAGQPLAEIVEILPPLEGAPKS